MRAPALRCAPTLTSTHRSRAKHGTCVHVAVLPAAAERKGAATGQSALWSASHSGSANLSKIVSCHLPVSASSGFESSACQRIIVTIDAASAQAGNAVQGVGATLRRKIVLQLLTAQREGGAQAFGRRKLRDTECPHQIWQPLFV